jgi:hypothetical protein
VRVAAARINHNLPSGWALPLGWQAYAIFGLLPLASPMQHLLPGSLLHNQYVYEHVHLQFSEIQHFLGFPVGRPETFFAYTNAWGSAFAMLTPFAICAMMQARSRAWRSARWRSPWAFWAHVTLLVALIQVPYYDITERLPIMLVAAAIAYREMMRAPAPEALPATARRAAIPRRRALAPG